MANYCENKSQTRLNKWLRQTTYMMIIHDIETLVADMHECDNTYKLINS